MTSRPVTVLLACAALALLASCSRHEPAPPTAAGEQRAAEPAPAAPAAPAPAAPAPATAPAVPATISISGDGGADFGREAKALFRVVACADGPLPDGIDAAVVAEHCAWLLPRIERYRAKYVSEAQPFLTALAPRDLPPVVVYPFGGGDLLSALTTYPGATEYNTLSLELAGDPRRIDGIGADNLKASLAQVRDSIAGLLAQNDSTSENLMQGQRGDIPGQLAFFLVALRVHGFEPVGLRYVTVLPDGTLHGLTPDEIAAQASRQARAQHRKWTSPDFSVAFSNSELVFRRAGAAEGEPLRVHRHFGANLADDALRRNAGLVRHLEAKGTVAAMTKAASYCLWSPSFQTIRGYLLGHAAFMISDSTGIPPSIASKAGFAQETYGVFHGSYLPASKPFNEEFRALWDNQPRRTLPFRYGYLDSAKGYHLLVTRREAKS